MAAPASMEHLTSQINGYQSLTGFLLLGTGQQLTKRSMRVSAVPRGRPPTREIRKEARGWGVTVEAGSRFYYASRTHARTARPSDTIGLNGRIS